MSRQTAIQTSNCNDIQVSNSCCQSPQTQRQVSPAQVQPSQENAWSYVPAMDVIEWAGEYTIAFDAPGLDAGHIDLLYERGVLNLHAPVPQRVSQGVRFLRQEYGVGDFDREVPLGRLAEFIDGDRISASYQEGVLTVTLPKLQQAQGRKITVRAA